MSVFSIHSRILIYLLSLGQTTVEDCFTILMDPVLQYSGHESGNTVRVTCRPSSRAVTANGILRPFYITYKAPGATSSTLGTHDKMLSKGKARAEPVQEGEDDAYGREGSLLPAKCMR